MPFSIKKILSFLDANTPQQNQTAEDGIMDIDSTSVKCKICGSNAKEKFSLPVSKKSGFPIPDLPDDCPYFECTACEFCFSTHLDNADHTNIYDETYWDNQDPDWHGRVNQSLRLVMLANTLLGKPPYELEVLDFGCGMGTFVDSCRNQLSMNVWGTDIIKPRFGVDYFLPSVDRKFDIIVACEVIEHLPNPVETLTTIASYLKPGGVFAFQTALWDTRSLGRDWWYIGPDNGHISLYSEMAFDRLYNMFGGTKRLTWGGYAGIQAWKIR